MSGIKDPMKSELCGFKFM